MGHVIHLASYFETSTGYPHVQVPDGSMYNYGPPGPSMPVLNVDRLVQRALAASDMVLAA